MKTLKLFSVITMMLLLLVGFQSQAQSRNVNKVLDNPEDRAYLMLQISNDKELTTEMIDYLSKNVDANAQLKAKYTKKDKMMMKKKMHAKKGQDSTKMEMCAMCKNKMHAKKGQDSTKTEMCAMCKKKMEQKKKEKQTDN